MTYLKLTGLALSLVMAVTGAEAASISVTVTAPHPPATIGVRLIRDYFIPEINRRVKEEVPDYSFNWNQAYAGSLADVNGTLEAVESGIADFGYVIHLFEADKLPLEQITWLVPYGTTDVDKLMTTITELHKQVPEMDDAWRQHNQMVLAPIGVDSYELATNFPVKGVEDVDGKKLSLAGLQANWMNGLGAIPVAGALPDYYNMVQSGLTSGLVTLGSAMGGYKLYEVAPYITQVNFGAMSVSALTVNLDTWNRFPKKVQKIIREVGEGYRVKAAKAYEEDHRKSLENARENGATITKASAEVRAQFADRMHNVALDWIKDMEAHGQPGRKVVETFLKLAKKNGVAYARDWLAEY